MLVALLSVFALVIVIGSVTEIHTQSSGYRHSSTTGFGALASKVARASTATGSRLSALMAGAPQLQNAALAHTAPPVLVSARDQLQLGLDQAVSDTASQSSEAATASATFPTGAIGTDFATVMNERAEAAGQLRTAVDQLLGMAPLVAAGSPGASATPTSGSTSPLISVDQATRLFAAAGDLIVQADAEYRALAASARRGGSTPLQLPRSVWAPPPVTSAALGANALAATASALSGAPALVPSHQLVLTAIGLTPPATTSGGVGVVGDSCADPVTTTPGTAPTLLPPTSTVAVSATLTNCGTVVESGVAVTATLALADPPGTVAPPAWDSGGRTQATADLRAGSSVSLDLPALNVAGGHTYVLTVAIAIPPGQLNPAGSTQQFVLLVTG